MLTFRFARCGLAFAGRLNDRVYSVQFRTATSNELRFDSMPLCRAKAIPSTKRPILDGAHHNHKQSLGVTHEESAMDLVAE